MQLTGGHASKIIVFNSGSLKLESKFYRLPLANMSGKDKNCLPPPPMLHTCSTAHLFLFWSTFYFEGTEPGAGPVIGTIRDKNIISDTQTPS